MRSALACFGRPQRNLITVALAAMARFYGCGRATHSGLSDAMIPGAEATFQKSTSTLMAILSSGKTSVAGGLLGVDEVCSPIQFFLDVNNTIVNSSGHGVWAWANTIGTNTVFKNNIVRQSDILIQDNDMIQSNNYTGTDPRFTGGNAYIADSYKLQSGSPCIDAGTAIAGITTDFAGMARPQGNVFNIGAFEYIDTGATPPSVRTSLSVTPSSATVVRGSTRQFTATVLDQFGLSMTTSDTVQWSTTVGSFGTTGLYQAPGNRWNPVEISKRFKSCLFKKHFAGICYVGITIFT